MLIFLKTSTTIGLFICNAVHFFKYFGQVTSVNETELKFKVENLNARSLRLNIVNFFLWS